MVSETLISKVVVTPDNTDASYSEVKANQLRTYLQENLGNQSKILTGTEYISPRTEPEGASTLGLNEIILLFGSGAGFAILQQVISLLVEWLKAQKQSSVTIEVDTIKITVSGKSQPEKLALELFNEIDSLKKKQSIIRP